MPPFEADGVGIVSFKNLGKSKTLEGEGINAYGSVVLKRKVDDVTYSYKATDTTFKNLRGLIGSVLSVSKPFGPLTATGGIELGPVRRLSAQLKGKWKDEQGRLLEFGALWSEKTGSTILSTVAQPHRSLKLLNTLNSRTQTLTSIAEIKYKGFTLAPATNWATGARGVALSHGIHNSATLKASYALDSRVAGLEYNYKPYKVLVSSKIEGPEAGHPTITFTVDRAINLSSIIRSNRAEPGRKVPDANRDIPLDTKLKELDALYEPKLAKAQAERKKHELQAKK